MTKHQGFSAPAIIIILALLAAGGYWVWKNQLGSPTSKSTLAPVTDTNIEPPTPPVPSTPNIDTTSWQTYKNDRHGFEFKYPKEARVEEVKMASSSAIIFYLNIFYSESKIYLLIKHKDGGKQLKDFVYTCAETEPLGDCISASPFTDFHLGNLSGITEGTNYYFLKTGDDNVIFDFVYSTQLNDKKVFDQVLSTFRFVK